MSNKNKQGIGQSNRQLKVGQLVRQILIEILLKQGFHSDDLSTSVTITEVVMSPDLQVAKVYYMPLNKEQKEKSLEQLKALSFQLRKLVGAKANLKYTPDLKFFVDESFDKMAKMQEIFASIKAEDN